MKLRLLKVSTFVLVLCAALSACQNEESVLEVTVPQGESMVKLVKIGENNEIIPVSGTRNASYDSNYALQFSSEAAYEEVLTKLKSMKYQEKLAFVDKLGLISIQKLLKIADDELEVIGSEALDENDFRVKYEAYKTKYSKYFVFNQVDKSDLSAYMPAGDKEASFVVGIDHKVVVGDRVEQIDFCQRMNNEDSLLFASGSLNEVQPSTRALKPEKDWPVNNFVVQPFSGKKTIFRFEPTSRYGKEFGVHFGSQKKMWYGWKRDTARNFYLKFGASSFQYLVRGAGGHPVWTNSPEHIYSFLGSGGDTDLVPIGRGLGGNVEGKAYIWTDQTIAKDANGNVALEKVNGLNYPKGDINNSLPCKLSWASGTY